MESRRYFNKRIFPIIILNNTSFEGEQCTMRFSLWTVFRKDGWHLPSLILSLATGRASSCIASVMDLVVYFTCYIAFLASVLKIIHLWYKTEVSSNYLISTHSMGNLELWNLQENFFCLKIKQDDCLTWHFSSLLQCCTFPW